jgi:MerR family transcriptional regulator, copper efflux regulator
VINATDPSNLDEERSVNDTGDSAGAAGIPIACSLSPAGLQTQLGEWRELLTAVAERQFIKGGLRLTFDSSASRAVILDLAAREHACCPFLDFDLDLDAERPVLEVRAPDEAQPIIEELFGGRG